MGAWRRVLGQGEHLCRLCGTEEETGDHLVLACDEVARLRKWDWVSWAELDDRYRWRYKVEGEGGKMLVRDKVEDFSVELDEVMRRVG